MKTALWHWRALAKRFGVGMGLFCLGLPAFAGALSLSLSVRLEPPAWFLAGARPLTAVLIGGKGQAAASSQPSLPASADTELETLAQKGVEAYEKGGDTAEKAWLDALKSSQAHVPGWMRNLHWFLCRAYANKDRLDKAIEHGKLALPQAEPTNAKDAKALASRLGRLGMIYYEAGQMDEALFYLSRTLDLTTRFHLGAVLEAPCRQGIGMVYHYWGQYEEALDNLRQARTLYLALSKDRDSKAANDGAVGAAECTGSMAIVYTNRGEYSRALQLYQAVLNMCAWGEVAHPEYKQQIGLGRIWVNLGKGLTYLLMERRDDAVNCFTQALVESRKLAEPDKLLTAHCEVALGYGLSQRGDVKRGDYVNGLKHSDQALAFYSTRQDKKVIAIAEGVRGFNLEGMGRLREAEQAYKASLTAGEEFGTQVGDASRLGEVQDIFPHPYAVTANLLVREGKKEEALTTVERGRGQGLAKQAAQSAISLDRMLRPEDAAELKRHAEALNMAGSRLRAMSSRAVPTDAAGQQRLAVQLTEAQAGYSEALRQLSGFRDSLLARPEYADYRRLQGTKPPTFAELVTLAQRHPDTLYLEWAIVNERTTLLFALSAQAGLNVFRLPVGMKTLTQQVSDWRAQIAARTSQEPRSARALYRALFGPLEQNGPLRSGHYRRLVLVADGPVLDVPFAALVDMQDKRLVEHYALASSVSLASLTWPDNRLTPSASLLCAADPTGQAELGDIGSVRHAFAPLPSARLEGKAVAKMFAGAAILVGPSATEAEIKRRMSRYTLLHFATHGSADSHNGLRSFLVLAEGDGEDGFLEAREIVEMRLEAQLVVLSACETALGQKSGGEGLLGLAWAFRAAGCPSVVASQWRVDDAATAKLMVAFYRALRDNGRPKDEALRQAMLSIKQDGIAAHRQPALWAAFAVIGDTSPLALPLRGR